VDVLQYHLHTNVGITCFRDAGCTLQDYWVLYLDCDVPGIEEIGEELSSFMNGRLVEVGAQVKGSECYRRCFGAMARDYHCHRNVDYTKPRCL